jgi:hypothetical protein
MTVYLSQSDLVAELLDDFDGIATAYVDERTIGPTEQDRRKLGLTDEGWGQFRRRTWCDDQTD